MPVTVGSEAYKRRLIKQNAKDKAKRAAKKAAARAALATANMAPVDPDRWRLDPIGWAAAALGVDRRSLVWSEHGGPYATHEWDGTPDPLAAVCGALVAGKWVGVESGKGTGKTYLAAILTLWFLENFKGATVITAAPKELQLSKAMWKEVGRFWPQFAARHPQAAINPLKLRMDPPREVDGVKIGGDAWSAFGWATGVGAAEESAAKAHGFHDEFQLIIAEEAQEIKPPVMTAFVETSTRPKTNLVLAIGNPSNQFDNLHQFCISPGVVHVRVSAYDHPNVVCKNDDLVRGAVSQAAIDKAVARYGIGAPRFESSVRGVSPEQSVEALIKKGWVVQAAERDVPAGAEALGVDVANSTNGDLAAIARGFGARLVSVVAFACPDANVMACEKVAPLIGASLLAKRVGVDAIGVGAGAVNELTRLGHKVTSIMSGLPGGIPRRGDVEQYLTLRAQMWWLLASDLQQGRVGGPGFADPELQQDLIVVTGGTRNGKIFVESKEKLRRLLGRSPNKADAVVYWNWTRQSSSSGFSGLGAAGEW